MKKITIYTDGGSRNNPGLSAIGVVFCNEKGQSFKKYAEFLGDNIANNEAEYQAVIFALEKFKALFGKKIASQSEVKIKSDSELLVKQLNGVFKVSDDNIKDLFFKVWNLKIDFKKVKFSFIRRTKNTEADALVNEVLDSKEKGQPCLYRRKSEC